MYSRVALGFLSTMMVISKVLTQEEMLPVSDNYLGVQESLVFLRQFHDQGSFQNNLKINLVRVLAQADGCDRILYIKYKVLENAYFGIGNVLEECSVVVHVGFNSGIYLVEDRVPKCRNVSPVNPTFYPLPYSPPDYPVDPPDYIPVV